MLLMRNPYYQIRLCKDSCEDIRCSDNEYGERLYRPKPDVGSLLNGIKSVWKVGQTRTGGAVVVQIPCMPMTGD